MFIDTYLRPYVTAPLLHCYDYYTPLLLLHYQLTSYDYYAPLLLITLYQQLTNSPTPRRSPSQVHA